MQVRNPYSPPTATVADEVVPPRQMPAAIRIALILMAVSLLLDFAIEAIRPASLTESAPGRLSTLALVISAVLVTGLTAWLAWKIAVGRNWARIVLLVLTILSVPSAILDILPIVRTWPLGTVLKIVEQCMDIAVVYLLFIPGRAWFRR